MGLLALLCTAFDQASKAVVRAMLLPGQSVPLVTGVLNLTRVNNTGVAFSLFNRHPSWMLILTVILFGVFLIFGLKSLSENPAGNHRQETIGFGLVLGGAAGNILDRLLQGRVTDFIDVTCIHYPVFNLADSFICIGVALLVWHGFRRESAGNGNS